MISGWLYQLKVLASSLLEESILKPLDVRVYNSYSRYIANFLQ